ncbi:MAG TPA: cell division protein FtsZ, partial [Pseudomonadales bacterium]|nr:cell division protein FtsZ [Pseudomonadales bacterium]
MNGEIKVSVVATGLGEERKAPVKVIDNTVGGGLASGQPNYRDLDKPAVGRRQAGTREIAERPPMAVGAERDLDYLDIPAFLRRQAD